MPFRVVNRSPRRNRPPPMAEKFPVSTAYRVHKPAAQIPDEVSVYSDTSSDNGTLHTEYSDGSKKGIPPGCVRDKGFPRYFGDEKQRLSEDYDPYAAENLEQASSSSRTLLGTVFQLASALGPDNILQTTEIDTIPCAGVRIPHGPLKGLLAWRLVVRVPEQSKFEDLWKVPDETKINQETRRRVHSMRLLPRPPAKPTYTTSHSACGHTKKVDTLASFGHRSFPSIQDAFTPPHLQRKPIALVSNFILDTSIPHSVISRDALGVLGYPLARFPIQKNSTSEDATITLSIQGVPTRLCIANHGEASRLGVQFLHDAGVSVFFPQNGDGIGPVLYLESAQLLKSVPSTLPRVRERKNTLPRRVIALLGLSS